MVVAWKKTQIASPSQVALFERNGIYNRVELTKGRRQEEKTALKEKECRSVAKFNGQMKKLEWGLLVRGHKVTKGRKLPI